MPISDNSEPLALELITKITNELAREVGKIAHGIPPRTFATQLRRSVNFAADPISGQRMDDGRNITKLEGVSVKFLNKAAFGSM